MENGRAAEKQAARERDAQALQDGTLTREELGRKNSFLRAEEWDIDFENAVPLR